MLFIIDDTSVFRDSNSSVDVITGAHDDSDSCLLASDNRFLNVWSERILKTKDSKSGQFLLQAISVIFFFKVIVVFFQQLKFSH